MTQDFWLGLGWAVAGLVGVAVIPMSGGALLSPSSYLPLLGAGGCCVAGIVMSALEFFRQQDAAPQAPRAAGGAEAAPAAASANVRFLSAVLVVAGLGLLVEQVGLVVAALAAQFGLFALVGRVSPLQAVVISALTVTAVYAAISLVLGVQIPTGDWWEALLRAHG